MALMATAILVAAAPPCAAQETIHFVTLSGATSGRGEVHVFDSGLLYACGATKQGGFFELIGFWDWSDGVRVGSYDGLNYLFGPFSGTFSLREVGGRLKGQFLDAEGGRTRVRTINQGPMDFQATSYNVGGVQLRQGEIFDFWRVILEGEHLSYPCDNAFVLEGAFGSSRGLEAITLYFGYGLGDRLFGTVQVLDLYSLELLDHGPFSGRLKGGGRTIKAQGLYLNSGDSFKVSGFREE
jgi:hypothetical protein